MCKAFVLKTDSPLFNDCDDMPIARYMNGGKANKLLKTQESGFQNLIAWTMIPMRDDVTKRVLRGFKQ